MCRWIVYIGEPLQRQGLMLEDLLIKPDHSIVKQVHERFLPGLCYGLEDNDKEELETEATWVNVHGFGVGWYTDTFKEFSPDPTTVKGMLPAHFRTIAPISTDLAFEQLCAHTASKCILAHIRNASFPPSVEVNNHPFIFGKYTFMHNGKVADFPLFRSDIISRISELQMVVQALELPSSVLNSNYVFNIRGNTDTEHLATLYFAHLDLVKAGIWFQRRQFPASNLQIPFDADSTDALLCALIRTIDDIHWIQHQRKVGAFEPGKDRAGNKFNLCITDSGNQMLACRWRDSKNGFPPSLYLSLTAGEKLNRKYPDSKFRKAEKNICDSDVKINSISQLIQENDIGPTDQGRHVIVGSEPCTENVNDWGLFDPNQCVTVDETHKLRIIDMTKFFQAGREHELEKYRFSDVFNQISSQISSYKGDTPLPMIGMPVQAINLPAPKTKVFETELYLKKKD
ncbi:hypothetical protein HHX47_DHR5000514 [Lentinula edodes]|nr:hypothetical protein HHX47_DHR5000514 [Lentinula edodes]